MSITKQEEDMRHELAAAAHVLWALHDAIAKNMQQDELYEAARVWLNVHQALRGDSGFPLPSALVEHPCVRHYPCKSTTHRVATPQESDGPLLRIVCVECATVWKIRPPCPHGLQARKCEHCSPKCHFVDREVMDQILARERTFIVDQQLESLEPGDIVTLRDVAVPGGIATRHRQIRVQQVDGCKNFRPGFGLAAMGFTLVQARGEGENDQ